MSCVLHQLLSRFRNLSFSTPHLYSSKHILESYLTRSNQITLVNGILLTVSRMFTKQQQMEVVVNGTTNKSINDSDKKCNDESNINDEKDKTVITLPTSEDEVKSVARLAASKIANGNIIAVPTDTIYGLGCLVQNGIAVQDLYSIKGRHPDKPVSVCVAEIQDIYRWGHVTVTPELLQDILPGPVTLCFSRKPELNTEFNPESELVGIRIPDHFFVRELCRKVQSFEGCCSPIALTSANVSGSDSCLEIKEFSDTLFNLPNSKLEMVFDGGRLGETRLSRLGSTIVDLSTKGYYKIIRQGSAEIHTVKILKKHGLLEACIDH